MVEEELSVHSNLRHNVSNLFKHSVFIGERNQIIHRRCLSFLVSFITRFIIMQD